jgi:hypothetical protein
MSLVNYSECLIKDVTDYPTSFLDSFTQYKKKVFSQHGEDGIIEQIFKIIGTYNNYYIEFGGWDGVYLSNTANLRINNGWSGLLLEGNKEKVMSMKNREEINLQNEWITKDNINDLFKKYNVPETFDLLSIDIDGDDYYVWKALDYKPRVVVVETNPGISNSLPLTILEGRTNVYKNNYFGANLHAFLDLASEKGYKFLTIEEHNAFFVLDSDFEKFGIKDNTKDEILKTAFIPSKYWCNQNNYTDSPNEWINLTKY